MLSCLGCFTVAKGNQTTFQKPLQVHALLTSLQLRPLRRLEGDGVQLRQCRLDGFTYCGAFLVLVKTHTVRVLGDYLGHGL